MTERQIILTFLYAVKSLISYSQNHVQPLEFFKS